jgi:DNA replication protein DnaC
MARQGGALTMGIATTTAKPQSAALARIAAACKELRITTFGRLVDSVCEEATRRRQSTRDVIAELLDAETEERRRRRVVRRLKEACFARTKTIEEFDFGRASNLPQALLIELIEGNYLGSAQGVVFIGEPGTGKSHLATALGVAACRQGRRVRFTTAANLVNSLVEAKDARCLGAVIRRYSRCELLIVDDFGYLPLAKHEAELLFQVLTERAEQRSMIITTNLPFSEFTKVIPDKRLCAAVLDRLTHNAHIIDTGSESQRRPLTVPKRSSKKGDKSSQ